VGVDGSGVGVASGVLVGTRVAVAWAVLVAAGVAVRAVVAVGLAAPFSSSAQAARPRVSTTAMASKNETQRIGLPPLSYGSAFLASG
jgi:hypothetical protein